MVRGRDLDIRAQRANEASLIWLWTGDDAAGSNLTITKAECMNDGVLRGRNEIIAFAQAFMKYDTHRE